ncbi:MAG: hypothetical protein VYA34_03590 [Myxococcota bacterium]|nr:hypothetical protein [Myxococcota bacterium]
MLELHELDALVVMCRFALKGLTQTAPPISVLSRLPISENRY